MAKKNRRTLKGYFADGQLPGEGAFEHLIDSSLNMIDDGFSKDSSHGLMIAPGKNSEALMSFYNGVEEQEAAWSIELKRRTQERQGGLGFKSEGSDNPAFLITGEGHVGVNRLTPEWTLDVGGTAGMQGRIGTFAASNEVAADGEWYNIVSGLDNAQGFEIVARTGMVNSGRHSLIHAIALSTFGRSRAKIKVTQSPYSFWRPCAINLRWFGDTRSYSLQIRSRRNLGAGTVVRFFVTKLWDDELMANPNQFHQKVATESTTPVDNAD